MRKQKLFETSKEMDLKMKVTLTMKRKIREKRKHFKSMIKKGCIYDVKNGFIACGKFKTPVDHMIKKGNDIFLYVVGFSPSGKKIIDVIKIGLTKEEAKVLIKVLKEGIK